MIMNHDKIQVLSFYFQLIILNIFFIRKNIVSFYLAQKKFEKYSN